MSPLIPLSGVVTVLPSLLADLTRQSMLVAGGVSVGVLAWVLWNALHSEPVPKYDPWANDREFGPADASTQGAAATFGGSETSHAAEGACRSVLDADACADGSSDEARPARSQPQDDRNEQAEVDTSAGDWRASSAEIDSDARAMLNEIEDPELRRMLAESLKQIEAGEPSEEAQP